jgi:ribosomal-protein-alanine N-acetyltransferase
VEAYREVTLRDYRPGDVEAMYALDVVCFEPVYRFTKRAMRRFAEATGAVTVIADAASELAGFTIAQMEGRVGYVVTLDVAPAWRRRGLARRLMDEAENRIAASGGLAMELHVFTGNLSAIRFYETIGYTRIGLAENFYARGMDALVYSKKLALKHEPG